MKSMEELVNEYFRPNRLPHLWCPGCGNGVVLGALLKAIDAEGLAKDDVAASAAPAALRAMWISTPETPSTAARCRFPPA